MLLSSCPPLNDKHQSLRRDGVAQCSSRPVGLFYLPFDFALIDKLKQPIGMIEFNGTQHYQPSDFSSKKSLEEVQKDFEIRVTRDKIKREYCEKNNIPLLIIPYKSKNNIEQLVNSFVKNCIDRIKQ